MLIDGSFDFSAGTSVYSCCSKAGAEKGKWARIWKRFRILRRLDELQIEKCFSYIEIGINAPTHLRFIENFCSNLYRRVWRLLNSHMYIVEMREKRSMREKFVGSRSSNALARK